MNSNQMCCHLPALLALTVFITCCHAGPLAHRRPDCSTDTTNPLCVQASNIRPLTASSRILRTIKCGRCGQLPYENKYPDTVIGGSSESDLDFILDSLSEDRLNKRRKRQAEKGRDNPNDYYGEYNSAADNSRQNPSADKQPIELNEQRNELNDIQTDDSRPYPSDLRMLMKRGRGRGRSGNFGGKRNNDGPSLSIVNSLDVLRNKLMLELARRKQKENMFRIESNGQLFRQIGKRSVGQTAGLRHTGNRATNYVLLSHSKVDQRNV